MVRRVNVHIEKQIAAQLDAVTVAPGVTKARIVNDALKAFFRNETDRSLEEATLRALTRMNADQKRLFHSNAVLLETVSLYVRYFLLITPALPESEQAMAQAKGRERFESFVSQVGRRMALDKGLLEETLEMLSTSSATITPQPKPAPPNDDDLPPLMPVDLSDYGELDEDEFDYEDDEPMNVNEEIVDEQ